jgi:hypothetical protein
LVVFTAPYLHHRLRIHRNDDLIFFGALDVHQRGLVAFQPSYWVLEIGIPDQNIEVEAAGDNQFMMHCHCNPFNAFEVTV